MGLLQWNFVCTIGPIIVFSNYDPGLILTYFKQTSNFGLGFITGKSENDFSFR